MNTQLSFLELVLPDPKEGAYYGIHWSTLGERDPTRKVWSSRGATDLAQSIRDIGTGMFFGGDMYVCMSSQSVIEHKIAKSGNAYVRALRHTDDAVELRSLFIDVDVKEGAYPTREAALAALKQFMDDTFMPTPSALVASGSGGFHAHWALERSMTLAEWFPLASALAEATRQHGLLCDTQCTVDAARILRIPGTLNHKTNPPNPTSLISLGVRHDNDTIDQILDPYKGVNTRTIGSVPFAFENNTGETNSLAGQKDANNDLGANLEVLPSKEIPLQNLTAACPFFARTLASGGKDNPQPIWFLTAAAATFVEDGRDALHLMSKGYPGYTPRETDDMFDRKVREKKEKNIGWPSCQSFHQYSAPECAACPLRGQGKSPLNFAKPQEIKVQDDTMPERYHRNADGIITLRAVNDDGTTLNIPLCHYPITSGWLSNNPWTFHFTTRSTAGRKSVMEIPTEVIFAKDSLPKYLGSKGFFLSDGQYKLLKEFFVNWIQKLQNSKDSVISASPFGWSDVDGKIEGFSYAGRVWMEDTDRPAANPNPVLSLQYSPKGDISIWRQMAEIIYSQNRPALDAILAVAFAGPLVRFTGFPGLIMNAYSSESGIGKTTAMKISQAVWGSPVLGMQGLNDTTNSVLGKMGQIRSLPMYWDEIKSEAQIKRFCGIVFELTGGREKTRMNADASLKLSGTWQTMLVSASNDSLVDGMAREVGSTTAGLHRLFEYTVAKPTGANKDNISRDLGNVQRLVGKLDDNYGHPGLTYAKFLGTRWKRVEMDVARLQDELYTEASVKQEERMWVATMAVVLQGAEYANELGLTEINIPNLRVFLFGVLQAMRTEVENSPSDLSNDVSVSSILAEFLNSTRARNTLVTNRIWIAKGRPQAGTVRILNDLTRLGDIMVQLGKEDRILRISSGALTRWMGERDYSRHTFMQKMESEFGLRKMSGKLGGGTELSCAVEYLLELDLNHPKLALLVE